MPNNLHTDAKRDRRREQIREAQARFRYRKDRTVEELKHRTVLLSEALEKVKADNRVLRAQLWKCERSDLVRDDPINDAEGPSATSQGPYTGPISPIGQRQRCPSSEMPRPLALSESLSPYWYEGEDGSLKDAPMPVGTSTLVSGRDYADVPAELRTYGPHMASGQAMQGSSHPMSKGPAPGKSGFPGNSPGSALEAICWELQEDFMSQNLSSVSNERSADHSRLPQQPQG